MRCEVLCGMAALLILLAGTVQSIGCSNCEGPSIPFESSTFRITKASTNGDDEEWLADALVDGQLDIDRGNDVATLTYTQDGTTYEVRFAIDE